MDFSENVPEKFDFIKPCIDGVSRDFSNVNPEYKGNSEPFCFLNIFKPRGITSFDVIYKLRKRFKIKKIGHSGTLDPLACGVMQVAVGKATRLLDYLGSDKKYVAKLRFGYFSSTADKEGNVAFFNVPKFTCEELLTALNSMIGEIEQIPPAYSAVKVGGKKLCDLARKNEKKITCSKHFNIKNEADLDVLFNKINNGLAGVEIPKRTVKIYEAKLLNFTTLDNLNNLDEKVPDEAEIEIFCSKGTYIRTFALDLAKKLGTSAYLTDLTRISAGSFDIKDSVKIDEVFLDEHGIKPYLALDLPIYELNEEEYRKTLNGVSFVSKAQMPENQALMLVYQNNLVSIAVLSDNNIICKKVFK